MGKFEGKIVAVTGSTRGIGRAAAIRFAEEGAKVVITGRGENTGAEVVQFIKNFGGEAIYQRTDVSKEEDIDRLVEAVIGTYGTIDILVNNAGVAGNFFATLEDITNEDWDEVINTNLPSNFWTIKKFMPYFQKKGKGVIVNVCSTASTGANQGGLMYTIAKHGQLGLTRQLAAMYGKDGVRINAVLPGATMTDMISGDLDKPNHPARVKVAMTPYGDFGDPRQLADVILFLASDDASFVYGTSLVADGGWTLL